MAIFKYIVVNKENKKLTGTVEAPTEIVAREELNNLGFSIITLQVTDNILTSSHKTTRYVFEAIDRNSRLISGTIPGERIDEVFTKLEQEYNLTVTAIWLEGSSGEQIEKAKKLGTQKLRDQLQLGQKKTDGVYIKSLQEEKEENYTRNKIEEILKQINEILPSFSDEIDASKKTEINKRIDKLLRIKHSTNLEYILETAKELLQFIQEQERSIRTQGHSDKHLAIQLQTQQLLSNLQKGLRKKTFSEDVLEKIEKWQKTHLLRDKKTSKLNTILASILNYIKNLFATPPEIAIIKDQIKAYNQQIIEFIFLYFKEPTKEYKDKVKNAIKATIAARKKAKSTLKHLKEIIKNKNPKPKAEDNFFTYLLEEITAFSGWLLAFYIAYYFVGLYITSKNFGLNQIPPGFAIYESHLFKYILVILFFLHTAVALKINFFKRNILADLIIFPVFFITTLIALLNF